MRFTAALSVAVALSLLLCSCKSSESTPPAASSTVTQEQSIGQTFQKACLKIRSSIIDTSVSPQTEAVFELYIDGDGDGEGLVSVMGEVFNVVVVSDTLYVVLTETDVVSISDITARMILDSVDLQHTVDLSTQGFRVEDGTPYSYTGRVGTLVVHSKYAQSSTTFDTVKVSATKETNMAGALQHITEYLEAQAQPEEPNTEIQNVYNKSKHGIEIEGVVFSVDDVCNPNTYFNGIQPEGLLTSSKHRQDELVEFVHPSYISDTGRTVLTLRDNNVVGITTTGDFKFLGIYRGTPEKEFKHLLGIGLTKTQQETFVPLDPDFNHVRTQNGKYECVLGDLKVDFYFEKSLLTRVVLEKPLDFE